MWTCIAPASHLHHTLPASHMIMHHVNMHHANLHRTCITPASHTIMHHANLHRTCITLYLHHTRSCIMRTCIAPASQFTCITPYLHHTRSCIMLTCIMRICIAPASHFTCITYNHASCELALHLHHTRSCIMRTCIAPASHMIMLMSTLMCEEWCLFVNAQALNTLSNASLCWYGAVQRHVIITSQNNYTYSHRLCMQCMLTSSLLRPDLSRCICVVWCVRHVIHIVRLGLCMIPSHTGSLLRPDLPRCICVFWCVHYLIRIVWLGLCMISSHTGGLLRPDLPRCMLVPCAWWVISN